MEIFEMLKEYISPELVVLVPALFCFGYFLKNTTFLEDKFIPITLGGSGVVLAALYSFATMSTGSAQDIALLVFTSIIQGLLCAGGAVYVDQLYKQTKK